MNGHQTAYIHFCHTLLQQSAESMLRGEGFKITTEESEADVAITDNIEQARNFTAPSVVFVSSGAQTPILPEKVFHLTRHFTGDDIRVVLTRGRQDYLPAQ
ncbi:MAG: hypothetical protein A3J67_05190 [Parcubacteria group bacterium RIFCSPHIGHO2_02_FULL_48_10b]|nr:MAG: hypothetical protein A3J67_05190 [Parcubacteria group bacterium RIFCSPHIGHO2_02_FULL_48_10b]